VHVREDVRVLTGTHGIADRDATPGVQENMAVHEDIVGHLDVLPEVEAYSLVSQEVLPASFEQSLRDHAPEEEREVDHDSDRQPVEDVPEKMEVPLLLRETELIMVPVPAFESKNPRGASELYGKG
jgi:hypothetical protein